jgi:diguanylate cyclase (GGDEF)-like protein
VNLRWRPRGLHAKFAVLAGAMLLLMLAVVALLLQRQGAMQADVARQSRDAMHQLLFDRLREHGQAQAAQVADALVNPLYYFDLDQIGVIARNILRQPDVGYVLVYDDDGDIIHDGSGDIPTYGQAMRDPLAYEAVSAPGVHAQWTDRVLEVSSPIKVGDERLGGVRIGYSLDGVRADEMRASTELGRRIGAIGTRHLWWIGFALLGLVALGAAASYALQRVLVRPIRELADAAREIEAGNFEASVAPGPRNDEVGDLMRAFGRMGDSIARHDREIRRMAYTDALTGLANRLAFRESLDQRLMQARGAGREMALLFADIDDFKRVNDTLGHDAGDEVLVQFSNRIRLAVERHGGAGDGSEPLLARFGGDEFVILLQGGGEGRDVRIPAEALAETLVAELARPIVVEGRQVFLGTSIGITLFPDDAAGATALMKNGDIAMYQAKVAGKNCYRFYSRAMDQAVERRVQLEQDLRGAWDRGELSVAYQPIYGLSDGRIRGAEALLRWQHPHLGMVPPSVFIEVAEQSGLIEQLGRNVLERACEEAARWEAHDEGELPFVSVNISPRQLRSGELPDVVSNALRSSGLQPQQLHLELTETAVLVDEAQASALLSRVRATGVKVWLDDFGTGFSGLSHLRRVPLDGVKIDRSFVADVLRDPDDLALTTAIIAMAHSLGITAVAEGIETEGQHQILKERGCDQGQGFWFGRPMSSPELAAKFAA